MGHNANGKTVAIIPARAGSKRLPGKNVKELAGRPLLAYSILAAWATPGIDEVWVTTDSRDYAALATEWGGHVVMRPLALAGDTVSTLDTLAHVLSRWGVNPGQMGIRPDWVVLLQPNCPLRDPSDIQSMIEVTQESYADGMLSVQPGPFKVGHTDRNNYWRPGYPFGSRKQDLPLDGREDGNIYVFKAENVWKNNRLHGKRMGAKASRPEQSLANVDTQSDWDLTEFLFHHYGYDEMFDELEAAWRKSLAPTPSS